MANDKNHGSGSGNFADNPQKASEAGRKGGQQSHGGQPAEGSKQSHQGSHQSHDTQQGGADTTGGKQRGGSGNFANDPENASEAGKKGGKNSHGG